MELLIYVVLFVGGALAGLYGSSVGGGSMVTFPLLIFSGLPTPIAIATNRFGAVCLEFTSALKFYREKIIDLKYGLILGFIAALGSYIGSNIVVKVNERYLNLIIAFILFILFFVLQFKDKLGIKEKMMDHQHLFIICFSTFLLGIYGGFFGGGFGTFIMLLLVLLGFSMVKSAAIGRLIGFIMSLTATLVFVFKGLINYPYAIALGLGSALGSWIGISIVVKKGDGWIKFLLSIIIFLTIIKLVLSFFNITLF